MLINLNSNKPVVILKLHSFSHIGRILFNIILQDKFCPQFKFLKGCYIVHNKNSTGHVFVIKLRKTIPSWSEFILYFKYIPYGFMRVSVIPNIFSDKIIYCRQTNSIVFWLSKDINWYEVAPSNKCAICIRISEIPFIAPRAF